MHVCAKFEADISIRSNVIRGPKISKFGHVTQATPTKGSFCGPDAAGVRHLCLCQIWGRYFYSFKCYKGVPKFQNLVTWPRPRPLRGRFVVQTQ